MREIIGLLKQKNINDIILLLLGLDTLRFIIASMGIVKRDLPILGRMIYGKYDISIVEEALEELGYSRQDSKRIKESLQNASKQGSFPEKDSAGMLIHILSQYIIKFDNEISYGVLAKNKSLSYSRYYVNTMEAVHNNGNLNDLAVIMIRLMKQKLDGKSPDFLVVPKGGNPLLAQAVANDLGISLIIAKDWNDSARPQESAERDKIYKIRYEGLDLLLNSNPNPGIKYRGVIIDCNTSGGTQLITIVRELNDTIKNCKLPIEEVTEAFVLFRLLKKAPGKSAGYEDINKKFEDAGCVLHRFFDLDEEDKSNIYELRDHKNYYDPSSQEDIHDAVKKIKDKKQFYFDDRV